MKSQYAVGLSKQAIEVYKLLLQDRSLAVNEIEQKLKITRQNVYRLTEHLISNGLIEKVEGYPVKYSAKSVNEARKNYLAEQGSWFSSLFSNSGLMGNIVKTVKDEKPFEILFFHNRDEHIEQLTKEVNKAKTSIKYIILVLPVGVPAELMHAQLQAIKRGVEFKLLALEHTKENHTILMSYKHMGAKVRHGKFLGWHLFLIDDDITSITMFDPENKIMQTGVYFVHKGINREMQGIFEKYWNEAVPV